MAASNKKPVARNSVIANSIDTAVYNLETALEKVNKAVAVRSAESKKMLNESKRMRKRHSTQINRKRRGTLIMASMSFTIIVSTIPPK